MNNILSDKRDLEKFIKVNNNLRLLLNNRRFIINSNNTESITFPSYYSTIK